MGEPYVKIIKTISIPVDQISSGKHQVRTQNVEVGIENLMNSIKKFGLIQPITVYQTPTGYELLTGQRRLVATTKLGLKEIMASIIEKPEDEEISKAISFIENEIRQKMSLRDIIVACESFYNRFRSIKMVAQELALDYELVRSAVNLPRAPPEVQKAVKNGEIDIEIAMRATDALRWDSGTVEEGKKVLDLAYRMREEKMPKSLMKNVVEVGKADPSENIETIIKKAKDSKKREYKVTLFQHDAEKLDKYADDAEVSSNEAATDLVLDGLKDKGYVK